jgi:hypothetical protein
MKDHFQKIVAIRPDYGVRKSAPVDLDLDRKLRDPANGLKPFGRSMKHDGMSGVEDLQGILAVQIGKMNALRGEIEPSGLRRRSFAHGIQEGGPMNGRSYVKLIGLDGRDKTGKLSLSNVYQVDTSGHLIIWESEFLGDKFDYVRLMKFYDLTHLGPLCEAEGVDDCPFFTRRAPEKVLKLRRRAGQTYELYLHKNYKWSALHLNNVVRSIAQRCHFDNADTFTMRSLRRTNLTAMTAGGCSRYVLQATR